MPSTDALDHPFDTSKPKPSKIDNRPLPKDKVQLTKNMDVPHMMAWDVIDGDGNDYVFVATLGGDMTTHDNGRAAYITRSDMYQINVSQSLEPKDRLKESKYRVLKPYWAKEMSATKAARELKAKGQSGYGKRTIEKYFAAMARAHDPSPTNKRGRATESWPKIPKATMF